jgi:hypothetical protein
MAKPALGALSGPRYVGRRQLVRRQGRAAPRDQACPWLSGVKHTLSQAGPLPEHGSSSLTKPGHRGGRPLEGIADTEDLGADRRDHGRAS